MKKSDKEYLGKVASIGCIICFRAGYPETPAEIHHIRDVGLGLGVRNSHTNTLPLCPLHHRGNDGIHGMGRKAWERKYTTQSELLEQVQRLLNEKD
jgi:hypothetical protein